MYTVKAREVHSPRHMAYDVLKGTQVMATCDTWPDSDEIIEQRARRIARALNRDAAMGEVREALAFTLRKLESLGYVGVDMDFSRQALAALDAAGKGE